MSDAAAVVNCDGEVVYANAACEKMFGGDNKSVTSTDDMFSVISKSLMEDAINAQAFRQALESDNDCSVGVSLNDVAGNSVRSTLRVMPLPEKKEIAAYLLLFGSPKSAQKGGEQGELGMLLSSSVAPVSMAKVDRGFCHLLASKKYLAFWNVDSLRNENASAMSIMSRDSAEYLNPHIKAAFNGEEILLEQKLTRIDGTKSWAKIVILPAYEGGQVSAAYIFITDIESSKRKQSQHQSLVNAINNGKDGFCIVDTEGRIGFSNRALTTLLGFSSEEMLEKKWQDVTDSASRKILLTRSFAAISESGHWHGDIVCKTKANTAIDLELSLTSIYEEGHGYVGMFCVVRDIRERKKTEKIMDYLAYNDSLTGLPNRAAFKKEVNQWLRRNKKLKQGFALLFIDLDLFKHVNDTYGHSFGDKLLQQVSLGLREAFGSKDYIARLSGDEFTVLLDNVACDAEVYPKLDRLLKIFEEPLRIDGREIFQGLSIGVSLFPDHGKSAETLMQNSDAAMYQVKSEGRKGYNVYTSKLSEFAEENFVYQTELFNALKKEEFNLAYQPIVDLRTNELIGCEALIRWQHPTLGLVAPERFIKFAEQSKAILPIGYWVIEQVCQQIKQWQAQHLYLGYVSLNVSGAQLLDGFAEKVDRILTRYDVNPDCIQIEITESFLAKNISEYLHELETLRENGLQLAIDDFGVGYSSLSQIKQLPIDQLKIDRSFISDITQDVDDRTLIEAILAIGKKLNFFITAEGVETAEQHLLLQKLGCHKAQGFYYSKPCFSDEFAEVYREVNARLGSTHKKVANF